MWLAVALVITHAEAAHHLMCNDARCVCVEHAEGKRNENMVGIGFKSRPCCENLTCVQGCDKMLGCAPMGHSPHFRPIIMPVLCATVISLPSNTTVLVAVQSSQG